jgi:hypothetical protein
MKATKTSRYIGMSWLALAREFRVHVKSRSEAIMLASFDDEEEAALAYDRVALHVRGPRTKLNFPDRGTLPASPAEIRDERRAAFKEKTTTSRRRAPTTRRLNASAARAASTSKIRERDHLGYPVFRTCAAASSSARRAFSISSSLSNCRAIASSTNTARLLPRRWGCTADANHSGVSSGISASSSVGIELLLGEGRTAGRDGSRARARDTCR